MSESCSTKHGYFSGRKTASREATWHDPVSGRDLFVVFGTTRAREDEINVSNLVTGAKIRVEKYGVGLTLEYDAAKLLGRKGRSGFDVEGVIEIQGRRAGELYLEGALGGLGDKIGESRDYAVRVLDAVAKWGSPAQIGVMAGKVKEWGWDRELLGSERAKLRGFFVSLMAHDSTRLEEEIKAKVGDSVGADLYLNEDDPASGADRLNWARLISERAGLVGVGAKYATLGAFKKMVDHPSASGVIGEMKANLWGLVSDPATEDQVRAKARVFYAGLAREIWWRDKSGGAEEIEELESKLEDPNLSGEERFGVFCDMTNLLDGGLTGRGRISSGVGLTARARMDRAREVFADLAIAVGTGPTKGCVRLRM